MNAEHWQRPAETRRAMRREAQDRLSACRVADQ
jgi:hypothetical protein